MAVRMNRLFRNDVLWSAHRFWGRSSHKTSPIEKQEDNNAYRSIDEHASVGRAGKGRTKPLLIAHDKPALLHLDGTRSPVLAVLGLIGDLGVDVASVVTFHLHDVDPLRALDVA